MIKFLQFFSLGAVVDSIDEGGGDDDCRELMLSPPQYILAIKFIKIADPITNFIIN